MDHNDRVLITGATGFIGGRLLEVLSNRGVRIRAVTSDLRNYDRVSRIPIEVVQADLGDHHALSQAVIGCDVIFHAAYKFGGTIEQQKVNIDGTRTLAEAFIRNGGRRFVHISSISAYGDPFDGELTEETPQRSSSDPYSETKRNIEKLLLKLHRTRGLPVTILQPAIVYGPYGRIWTTSLLEQVRSMRIVLPVGGLGICNAVYIDDVVSALTLAASSNSAVGETFLVSGSSPTTWRKFYEAYENMLEKRAIIDLDDAQIRIEERRQRKGRSFTRRFRRALARRPELRQSFLNLPPLGWFLAAAQRVLSDRVKAAVSSGYESLWNCPPDASDAEPLFLPPGALHALYSSRTYVRIDKARMKLGYNPAFDLSNGMARTAEWARRSNLLSH